MLPFVAAAPLVFSVFMDNIKYINNYGIQWVHLISLFKIGCLILNPIKQVLHTVAEKVHMVCITGF